MSSSTDHRPSRIRWVTSPPATVAQLLANGIARRHAGVPADLVRHTRTPAVGLVPACCTPTADTICDCGGLLAMVAGVWRHLDRCVACNGRADACGRRHVSCTMPEPRQCQGRRCSAPVTAAADVAAGGDPQVCDSCSRGCG